MRKNMYIDLHVLETVPPSCVNRDDTGSPKTAVYGGTVRARISSQCWKRAIRQSFQHLLLQEEIGLRTKHIHELLTQAIGTRNPQSNAEKLAEEMELPMNARLIRRVKKTKRQKELGPAERRKNLEGAFALAKPGQMKYCRILLVDDIYTTGSTVDAIASLLKVNGAEQVDFVCAAIVK